MNNVINEREDVLLKIKEFRLLDDNFMSRVFDDNTECTELILRIILDRPDIKVREVHTQREIKNLLGHSVRLDIEAVDMDGNQIDVEVQRMDKGAGVRRARYNSSMLDVNTLVKGEDYYNLSDSYVIFITENDVMGTNLPIYHVDRIVKETGEAFGDGAHIIYVNGSYRGEDSIGRLMHDFSCKNPEDMYYKPLAESVRYYKQETKGVKAMCRIVEELIEEEKKYMIIKMKKMDKFSNEDISEITGFTIEQIEEIAKQNLLICV